MPALWIRSQVASYPERTGVEILAEGRRLDAWRSGGKQVKYFDIGEVRYRRSELQPQALTNIRSLFYFYKVDIK